MNVHLFSSDRPLHRLCSEVLAEIAGGDWMLTMVPAPAGSDYSEPAIWDYPPEMPLPPAVATTPSKHLFIVESHHLDDLREKLGAGHAMILVKPVTRATLAAFLGEAFGSTRDGLSIAQSLKADRDEILQCLIQANLRLQEYDQDRTTLLARGVHDSQAPLTAISGYCGLLLSESLGQLTDSQREVLRRMQYSARRLSRMATAMLQLSSARHTNPRYDLKPGDIRECVEQALVEITPFAEEKSLTITTDFVPTEQPLRFEAGQVEQVLINVLSNACRFTPKAGSIEMSGYPYFWERRVSRSAVPSEAERRQRARLQPNSYRVDVRNSGSAIPPEHLDQIFEEYMSYAGSRDRSGGGLGLAITRMIVSKHDGRVWAENKEHGPMVSFVLPM